MKLNCDDRVTVPLSVARLIGASFNDNCRTLGARGTCLALEGILKCQSKEQITYHPFWKMLFNVTSSLFFIQAEHDLKK